MHDDEELSGGNAGGEVRRVGGTVRKAWNESTPSVHAFVRALRDRGIDAPEPLGRDDQGRQILEFVPGVLALDAPRLTSAELHRAGAQVRAIHDIASQFTPAADAVWETAIPAPGADLICHNDLAPWNLLTGERWVFIDWDAAAPSTRLWDLAYAAQAFTLSRVHDAPAVAAADLRAFVDGYAADDELRSQLPDAMRDRATAMLDLLRSSHEIGREPWSSMYVDGHGAHWSAAVDYVTAHRDVWLDALSR
ncbi:phosphotransferase [Microbacterium maritypicum]